MLDVAVACDIFPTFPVEVWEARISCPDGLGRADASVLFATSTWAVWVGGAELLFLFFLLALFLALRSEGAGAPAGRLAAAMSELAALASVASTVFG